MSSQEEYLDKLLNDLTDDLTKELGEDIPTVETVTEDDIAAADDLMSLLGGSEDDELLEIQDLLQKADNNEMIEDDIVSLLEGIEEETPVVDAGAAVLTAAVAPNAVEEQAGDVAASELSVDAEEQKRQREAQKEAKKAEKEAKKAEKLAQREAKKAEKLAQKEAKKAEMLAAKEAKKAEKAAKKKNTAEDGAALQEDKAEELSVETSETEAESAVDTAKLEEDIFAGIASLDLFGDAESDVAGVDVFSGAVGEDSLEQIINDEKKAKKKGLFSRIVTFFTEEDEEKENENISISDENREIMKEMDKEEKKKKKGKKSKKGKKGEAPEGEAEEGAEEEAQDSKKKKKKEKKPKKEKAPKVKVVEEETNRKRLSFKHVGSIFAVCLSIGILIILSTTVIGDYAMKASGRKAYYEGDYQTCYQSLYGKQLSETEQVMYSKSESILTMRMWIREYELLAQEGAELEALDSLIQSVYEYPTVYLYADKWNAGAEVAEIYSQILLILSEKYELTEEQAMEIASTPNDVEYTKMVMAIVAGEGFGSWNESEEKKEEVTVLPDVLPEEAGLGGSAFVDNKAAK